MFGLFSGIKTFLIGGAVLSVVGFAAWMYISNLQDKLELERVNRIQAEQAAEKNLETVNRLSEEAEENEENRRRLERETREIRQRNDELRRLLLDHDLTNLAEEKPGLIEKRINDATKRVLEGITDFTINNGPR